MNTCIDCNTENNIVHSGIDAFALEVMQWVGQICYPCAQEHYNMQNAWV